MWPLIYTDAISCLSWGAYVFLRVNQEGMQMYFVPNAAAMIPALVCVDAETRVRAMVFAGQALVEHFAV
jgi:hypothetical protein